MLDVFKLFIITLFIVCSSAEPVIKNCSYSNNNINNCSRCDIRGELKIYYENQELIIENAENRTNLTTFAVQDKVVLYFPQGISDCFPKLKALQISNSGLKKILSKDLENFTSLEHLNLDYNKIEVLEENLFKFNKNLSTIFLNSNKIKEIDPTAFDGVTGIKDLGLYQNLCCNESGSNSAISSLIINNLKKKCWSESLEIKKYFLSVIKLDKEIEIIRKIVNFTSYDLINRLSNMNSSEKYDFGILNLSSMTCICKSPNCDTDSRILFSAAFHRLSFMEILVIINIFMLFIVTIVLLTLKCSRKSENVDKKKTPAALNNIIYDEIGKAQSGHNKVNRTKSMELLEKNYHETDENYDEISEAIVQEEYSTVINAGEGVVVGVENEELYSEVGQLSIVNEDFQGDAVDENEKKLQEEIIYAEVTKRSSGWI